ncbi:hypothetical protein NLI96_g7769 [Meripilus lineatus]|uniref:Uncharacterized protein n=1 Tax=Meripilus lineatus TaxID=2056292 RepID=A0AAD5YBQ9_9APHY|nr:hypothetical protein NLI96_g7769 [Physisporinus lineatus]
MEIRETTPGGEGIELPQIPSYADSTRSRGLPNPITIPIASLQNQRGGSVNRGPRQTHTQSFRNESLSGTTRMEMLMESRLGEKKSKKGREAMEPNFADVASKNTDGWTNASNVFAKFDGTKPKRHNENFVTLLVFTSIIPTPFVPNRNSIWANA